MVLAELQGWSKGHVLGRKKTYRGSISFFFNSVFRGRLSSLWAKFNPM